MHLDSRGYIRTGRIGVGDNNFEHIKVAEKVLGKKLPKGAVVHHVDEDPTNNTPTNLVVCPSRAYHRLLHARLRIQNAGGHPDKDKVCGECRELKPKNQFYKDKNRWDGRTPECAACRKVLST